MLVVLMMVVVMVGACSGKGRERGTAEGVKRLLNGDEIVLGKKN